MSNQQTRAGDGYREFAQAVSGIIDTPRRSSPRDCRIILSFLGGYLSNHFPFLTPADQDEHVAEAVARLLAAAQARRINTGGNPAGYLLAIAGNLVRDRSRGAARSARVPYAVEDLYVPDDVAAAQLEKVVTADVVRCALHTAVHRGDRTVVLVVTYFLDRTQVTGVRPSNREIAQALGLSHSGVAIALTRFRAYLR